MDVSLRHWPIFMTGLLLGAAGTMALGLHRPTQAELAAAIAASRPAVAVAAPAAPSAVAAPAAPVESAQAAESRMLAAAEAFRAQEARAAVEAPYSVAVVAPPKPRLRKIVKEPEAELASVAESVPAPAPVANTSPPIAIAPESSGPTLLRASTSVMGAAGDTHAASD